MRFVTERVTNYFPHRFWCFFGAISSLIWCDYRDMLNAGMVIVNSDHVPVMTPQLLRC